jgi:hypothetical protein
MMKLTKKVGGMLKAKQAAGKVPGMKMHGTASKIGAKMSAPKMMPGTARKAGGMKPAPKAAGGARIGPGPAKSRLR